MKLSSIQGNRQKLDGGSMFGNAPRALWSRWTTPDDRHRIDLACRGLLVEIGKHKILFETGIGAYMPPKLKDRFGVQEPNHVLLESLNALGLSHEDITTVILSHLHFDHAGGLLSEWRETETPHLLFPNATFYVGEKAWERAINPHPRDRASFIPELNEQLENSDRLSLLKPDSIIHFEDLEVHFFASEGHTPGMMCADLYWQGSRMVFAADLIPGRFWVHLPITMGYDRYPERLIDEKKMLLSQLLKDKGWLYFTHDSEVAAAELGWNEDKQKFQPGQVQETMVRAPFPGCST